VYSIFAFAVFIPLIFILPRLTDSLHPGNGGNPGFNAYDMDSSLRMVFYPAIIGWTLLGTWISTVRVRLRRLERKLEDKLINQ
jgi:heme exporter protein C